ncbi:retropepsin-like aspartic protease family protein [Hyphomicrobium sp.]|uniref:retropepsin-like aspartic protease family protein n=1 Tax=Hyphomicrobium sp. TaxID=82 RepID=UPI002E314EEB|nr:TIGR02281 family clan AA aspartic protease [Hyphomicrobium sp.]HEX2842901.1 TIGR02281 family clan AA aspartic protease [Hyphomicrobium sp.]
MLAILVAILAGLVVLFWSLDGDTDQLAAVAGDNAIYIIGALALLALYLATVSGDYQGRKRDAVRHLATWLAIGLALVVAYTYRAELKTIAYRVAGEVLPPGHTLLVDTAPSGEQAVRLRRHDNGHFVARGAANGVSIALLVDTGASTVVLKPADAERIGIDIKQLSYTTPVSTANGTTFAAPVRLKSVSVGPLEVRDVEALVAQPGALSENLLGMSFLKRLRSYEFSGDFLTLRG